MLRSKTTHVATVPSSLGPRGSVLKPAVFQDDASKNAPFLISLPFLMHCRAVLHLDPDEGLRIEFKRFGFTTKCHLGPTGALRVPLGNFTKTQKKCLEKTHDEVAMKHQEFEVLRTTAISNNGDQSSPCGEPSRDERDSHGDSRVQQEGQTGGVAGCRDPDPIGLDSDRCQAPVHHGASINSDVPIDVAKADLPESLLSMADDQEARSYAVGHCGVSRGRRDGRRLDGELSDDRDTNWRRCSESNIEDIKGVNRSLIEHQGRTLSHRGGLPDVGHGSQMCSQLHGPGMDDQETGSELRPDLLEMPRSAGETVQLLPVDGIPTGMERGASSRPILSGQEDSDTKSREREVASIGIYNTTELVGNQVTTSLSTSSHNEGRKQRVCGSNEVSGMWQGDSREAPGALQPDQSDQRERGAHPGERQQSRRDGKQQSLEEPHRAGDSGLRGLQGLSELAKEPDSSREEVESDHEQWMTEWEKTAGELTKRGKRVVQQGIAALKQAERCVQEIMNLVRTEPTKVEMTGWQKPQSEAF